MSSGLRDHARHSLAAIVRFRKSLRLRFAMSLIGVGARWRIPWITLVGLLLGTRRARHFAGSRLLERRRRTNIVAFQNAGLVSDLESAFVGDAAVRLRFIPGGLWKVIGQWFLSGPPTDFEQLSHRERHPEQHEAHVRFLRRVVPRYLSILRSETLVIGNFTHWMAHGVGASLEGSGHRLVVVHKEGLISAWPSVASDYAQTVIPGVGPTTAERISVYSRSTKDLIAECGIASADRISVTGAVRLDSCHQFRRRHADGTPRHFKRVTFFTFWPSVGVRLSPSESLDSAEPPDWSRMLAMTLDVAGRLASSRPGAEVVIKSKGWVSRLPDIAPTLKYLAESGRPNLSVQSLGEGQELVLSSDAIVAFNSTIILEAIAAGTPVFVPDWDLVQRPEHRQYVLELGETVRYASSTAMLLAQLQASLDGRPVVRRAELTAEEMHVLDRYAGNKDGKSAERLAAFLSLRRSQGTRS